ncbi:hypothetical protein [Bradyrhizobium sp. CIR3A]|uniref:hypothetical protein n=1 Tax=Bradyrhizobium sp. CIR3A TaxID=2663838 RepID=UPI0017CE5A64|nr:hypothetical protein [Bradyrhizobium sp. CIR3A]MBB4259158.1 Asp-tRNA(Asn)/Glu-tRNA(Gln) amidotransferase A subunit family amidase [Bradyrhizobium sp. CIR3A]
MDQPIRGDARLAPIVAGTEGPAALAPEHAPLSEIVDALAGGQLTASALAELYLARIEAYDRNGPATQFRPRAQSRCARDRGGAGRHQAIGRAAAGRRADIVEG